MNRDKFRTQFAILCVVAILATSGAAAASVPLLFGGAAPPLASYIECWFFPMLPWCHRPPDPVKPDIEPVPEPTPPCDPETQSCPQN
jgi:hypothetical protein